MSTRVEQKEDNKIKKIIKITMKQAKKREKSHKRVKFVRHAWVKA